MSLCCDALLPASGNILAQTCLCYTQERCVSLCISIVHTPPGMHPGSTWRGHVEVDLDFTT